MIPVGIVMDIAALVGGVEVKRVGIKNLVTIVIGSGAETYIGELVI